jgi:hypothetical protein
MCVCVCGHTGGAGVRQAGWGVGSGSPTRSCAGRRAVAAEEATCGRHAKRRTQRDPAPASPRATHTLRRAVISVCGCFGGIGHRGVWQASGRWGGGEESECCAFSRQAEVLIRDARRVGRSRAAYRLDVEPRSQKGPKTWKNRPDGKRTARALSRSIFVVLVSRRAVRAPRLLLMVVFGCTMGSRECSSHHH